MNKKFLVLLPLLLLLAPICSAQSDQNQGQIWLPPSWVFGSGYTPYDYPMSMGGIWGYDPFAYYNYQGKTYHPYSYSYYYPEGVWYPYRYPYSYSYPYRYPYWYPSNYYGNDLWSW